MARPSRGPAAATTAKRRVPSPGSSLAVLATTVAGGLDPRRLVDPQTADYSALRDVILSRHRARPFREVDVIGPDARPYSRPRPPHDQAAGSGSSSARPSPDRSRALATTDELLAPPPRPTAPGW